jgi:hypothetical protein
MAEKIEYPAVKVLRESAEALYYLYENGDPRKFNLEKALELAQKLDRMQKMAVDLAEAVHPSNSKKDEVEIQKSLDKANFDTSEFDGE